MIKSLYRKETNTLLEVFKKYRRDAALTQTQCSLALARPQSFMSDVERGVRRLDLIQLRDLCIVFGISLPCFVQYFEDQLATEEKPSVEQEQEQEQELA